MPPQFSRTTMHTPDHQPTITRTSAVEPKPGDIVTLHAPMPVSRGISLVMLGLGLGLCLGLAGCSSLPAGPADRDDYYKIYRDRCLSGGINRPSYCDR